jgi:putative sigma-54 modulation protein
MHLKLTGHHVEVTQSMRAYVEKKLERITRHFDQVIDVSCNIHADAVETDMYAAIDSLTDKLDRSIVKHKEKQQDHHASEGRKAARP